MTIFRAPPRETVNPFDPAFLTGDAQYHPVIDPTGTGSARIAVGPPNIDPVGPRYGIPIGGFDPVPVPVPSDPIPPPKKTPIPDPFPTPISDPIPTPTPTPTGGSGTLSCPPGQSVLRAGYNRNYADGSILRNTTGADMCAPNENGGTQIPTGLPEINPPKTVTNTDPNTTVPATGGSAAGSAADADLIKSLMGLVANQFAGAGVSGGGTGFDGQVSAPLSPTATDAAAPVSGSNKGILFLVLGVAVVAGVWYWRKHRGTK